MLAAKVLAHGVTHLTDARYFAAWEVDYLCFLLDPTNPEATTMEYLLAMREWIQGPEIVVEMGNYSGADAGAKLILEQAKAAGLTQLLVDYGAPVAELRAAGFTPHVRIPVAGYDTILDVLDRLAEVAAEAGELILDFSAGGIEWTDLEEGRPFRADKLGELDTLNAISIGQRDPKVLVARHALRGFSVRGSSEEKVGYKSFDELDDLFEGLETFD